MAAWQINILGIVETFGVRHSALPHSAQKYQIRTNIKKIKKSLRKMWLSALPDCILDYTWSCIMSKLGCIL